MQGSVKWWNASRGYGLIMPFSHGPDIFVHVAAVEAAGWAALDDYQVVEFDVVSQRGKIMAINLRHPGARSIPKWLVSAAIFSASAAVFAIAFLLFD